MTSGVTRSDKNINIIQIKSPKALWSTYLFSEFHLSWFRHTDTSHRDIPCIIKHLLQKCQSLSFTNKSILILALSVTCLNFLLFYITYFQSDHWVSKSRYLCETFQFGRKTYSWRKLVHYNYRWLALYHRIYKRCTAENKKVKYLYFRPYQ